MIEFISPCTGTLASEQQTRRHSEARCSHSCRHSQSQSYTNLQLNKTGRGAWKNTKGQEHRSNVAEQSDRQTAASLILVFYFPHHLLSQRRLKKSCLSVLHRHKLKSLVPVTSVCRAFVQPQTVCQAGFTAAAERYRLGRSHCYYDLKANGIFELKWDFSV